jgi:flagellar protein FliS
MSSLGANVYRKLAAETSLSSADPHRMVMMLFDGVLEAIRIAALHMTAGRTAEKGKLLSKALRIVEEGLKASLDKEAGGALANQLASLYDYASLRLLQANLRNDHHALTEVAKLLADLRDAWAQIAPRTSARSGEQSQLAELRQPQSRMHLANPSASDSLPAIANDSGPRTVRVIDGVSTTQARRVTVVA